MNDDYDHVAVHTDRGTMYWALVVPSDAKTCEEQTREMTALCEQLFDTFGEFLTPTEIEFHVPCFPPGHELPASRSDDAKIKTAHRELRSSSGISVDDVLSATRINDCPSRWLPLISFNGAKVLVELEEGPVVADRNNHTVEYRRKRSTDQMPARDPLELELLHGPNSWKSEIKSEFVTSVMVRTVSDIWFDDSELGQANARNLAAFLERIDQTLSVQKINRASDWLPVEQLQNIY
ncbi:hypothetical protein SAMN06269185_2387 [Natronoarchaeum philippinense]|uniref:Uncharacterized protein n=1 Tax=Natronoarchaeum philippinense TaxID=558529 RepID=A0A285P072_NATPI|nr:hypothetical protein [Natronoarchaeum philippinense]SNZ15125.1 hypothetical protein SAMN06269185_2387 [Natronoarchaeum philippinense]